MKVISYIFSILNPQEQKLSTPDRELFGIVHALQIYEFLIIGSMSSGLTHGLTHFRSMSSLMSKILQSSKATNNIL